LALLGVQTRDDRERPSTTVVAPPHRHRHPELAPERARDDVESALGPICVEELAADVRDAGERLHFAFETLSLVETCEHAGELTRHRGQHARALLDRVSWRL